MLLISKGTPLIYTVLISNLINSYHDELSCDPDSVYLSELGVFSKDPVAHECVVLVILYVVYVEDQGVVGVLGLEYFVGLQMLHLEGDLIEGDLLVHPISQLQLLHIVLSIGSVEHGRHIIHVSLLVNANVHSDGTRGQRVYLERDLDFIVRC